MNTENFVLLIGYVGMDANLSQSASGDKYCRFSIATSNYQRSKKDGTIKKSTVWHDIVCFGKTAEYAADLSKKGALVLIKGRIERSEWEDGAGNKSISYSIIANTVNKIKNPTQRDSERINSDEYEEDVEFIEPDEQEDEDSAQIA